ncbi:MAG TPA: phosphoglycerate mutase family protein [Vicinamibacterales bacterium]|jgi:broad specificity phosphatase PhoE|nr:phosphoglycerate mutase family protein [Vicinamibacterales bacterium]
MMRNTLLILCLLIDPAVAAAQTIFVVRHAERADAGMAAAPGADPDLSAAGRVRAESLAWVLKDARITRIYTSELKRTRQTAEPMARAAGVEATSVPARDVAALLEQVKAGKGNTLIVGHSNTVPEILKGLGVVEAVAIDDAEHDNLFIVTTVTTAAGEGRTFVRVRYR